MNKSTNSAFRLPFGWRNVCIWIIACAHIEGFSSGSKELVHFPQIHSTKWRAQRPPYKSIISNANTTLFAAIQYRVPYDLACFFSHLEWPTIQLHIFDKWHHGNATGLTKALGIPIGLHVEWHGYALRQEQDPAAVSLSHYLAALTAHDAHKTPSITRYHKWCLIDD